jgi:hypothetical protein
MVIVRNISRLLLDELFIPFEGFNMQSSGNI